MSLLRSSLFPFCFFLIFNLYSFILYSQKVAVVFSGGGPKGLAHIGVLKALEENQIPINYIAGTSIGAIIGGLYASGYSPDSIEKIFMSDEMIRWATGEIDEKYLYYFKTPDQNASWVSVRFDYNNGWKYNFPSNLISPVQMDFAFNEIFSGASAVSDYKFDSLFVPFRCVASDITENKPVIFNSGDVGLAIRASMTVPFYFKPIKINNKLMFDGGMYNNFPTDVVYDDFNPDFIVGSQVALNVQPPRENDIMSQIYSMLMNRKNYSLICKNSIIIEPNVPHNYNITDFNERKNYIDSGYVSTIRSINYIKGFVSEKVSKQDIDKKRKVFNDKKPSLIIDKLYVDGVNKYQKLYVLKNLLHKTDKVPLKEFKKNYYKLIADDKIEHISPILQYNKNSGYYDMYLNVTKQKRFAAQFGGIVSSSPVNEAFIGFQYNSLSTNAFSANVNSYFGRFYNSFKILGRIDFSTKLPFYLKASTTYNHWDYFQMQKSFLSDKTPSYLIQKETHSDLNLGIPARNKGKFEIGTTYAHLRKDYYQKNYFTRADTTDQNFFNLLSAEILYDRNTLKNKQFSNQGTRLIMELRYVSGKETNYPGSTSLDKAINKNSHNWLQYKLSYENYFKTFGKLKLGLYTELRLSNQDNFTNYTSSLLAAPAFQPTPNSKAEFNPHFRAYNFLGIGLKNIYMITRFLDFRIEGFIFIPYQEIIQNSSNIPNKYPMPPTVSLGKPFEKRYFMGMSALVFQTPVGPISLGLNYYDKANLYENRFSVLFSFGYIIFNNRALE